MSPLPAIPSYLSCSTARSCTAVGLTIVGSEAVEMAEHWDGVSWTLQTTPPPPAGAIGSQLLGISCPAANSCFAIGDYHKKQGSRTRIPLAEHWDGSNWKIQPISGPPGKTYFGFDGLSCSSPQFCMAIGEYGHGMFTDTWNGAGWTAKLITRPGSPAVPSLSAISCSSAKACLAVGFGTAELWNGTKWRKCRRHPQGRLDGHRAQSVSCASATDCEAVGLTSRRRGRSSPNCGTERSGLFRLACRRLRIHGWPGYQHLLPSPVNCIAVGSLRAPNSLEATTLALRYS